VTLRAPFRNLIEGAKSRLRPVRMTPLVAILGLLPAALATALLREALQLFEQAEALRPAGNDEAILRWNRCVRLIRSRPELEWSTRDTR